MKRVFWACCAHVLLGVGSGLFFREFTKLNGFPEGGATQLSVVHTHLLTLGFFGLLTVLLLDRAFGLSGSRLFSWFFWLYNAGLVLTAGMLTWHGMLTVLGQPSSKMIAGIAGLGHMLLSAGMIILLVALGRAVTGAATTDQVRSRRSGTATDTAAAATA